jgi:transposase
LLTAQGVAAYVLEPTSVLVNRRARRAKTDRLDAEGMVRVLASWLSGDRKICSMLRVPTPEQEDAKRRHREREHLIQDRVRIENRIEALLFTQGIRKRPSLRSWSRDLDALRTGDGRALLPLLRAELDRLRRRLELVLELIRELEAEREATLSAATDRSSQQIAALQQIRGIGANFAAVLVHEVFYRGFQNRRQLASYVGIAPTPHKSGTMDRDRGISQAGNPRARTTLIQLAWLWLRYQPGSELAIWFRARVGALQGRTRRIAIVAIARKLLIALWRYVESGLIPAGITLRAELQAGVQDNRVGRKQRRRLRHRRDATVFLIGGQRPPRFRWVASTGRSLVQEALGFRAIRPSRMQGDAAAAAIRKRPGLQSPSLCQRREDRMHKRD